ncbi:MAG: hypothetical protein KAY37_08530 [Phycisphaerae bacterium]|nr:hypothetical protein [Phycisphaerae bacterium]
MHARTVCLLLVVGLLGATVGCVSVTAPEKVTIGGSSRPEQVDSSRVPPTSSHEEARRELEKAYRFIRHLEDENAHHDRKAAKYKRERDECEGRLERYEGD